MCFSKINSSTIGTMRRTAITVYYLQMLCLLVVLLLSSKSYFSRWGTAFFEEFSLVVGVLACLLSSKSCSAYCAICFWPLRRFTLLVGLLGLLRGDLLSLAFQFL